MSNSVYSYRGFSSVGVLTPFGMYTDSVSGIPSFDSFIDQLLYEFAKIKKSPNPSAFALQFPNLVGSDAGVNEAEPNGISRIRRAGIYDYSPIYEAIKKSE
jgi:hypothetical protein